MRRVAIIDLGTNTFHLLIADINAHNLHVLHKEKKNVKIGEDGISQGKIAEPAQERALSTLQAFKQKINTMGAQQTYATATSAFRNAVNGKALALEIFKRTGIEIEIIDGYQEARFIYQGVKKALDLGMSNSLIMDIGGGSVEFIIANKEDVRWMQSFEIGAQRLLDQFHHQDPINADEIKQLESFLDSKLKPLATAVKQLKPDTLVGSSGTFDTLSHIYSLKQGMVKTENPEQPLSLEGFKQIYNELMVKNRAERLKIPGMIEMRVDMIVVASTMINFLLNRFGFSRFRVSSYALKEGVLHDVWHKIRQSV